MLFDNVTLRRIACASLIGVLLLGAPTVAFAEEPSPETQTEAKARLQQGAKAYSKGRYKDAVDLFLSANELVPSPALSFNIAKAYEKLGDSAATLNWYRDYLRRAPDAADRADVDRLIGKYQRILRDRGVQQVTVLSTPEGATVVLDGQPVGVTPWTGERSPGKHIATLQMRGYADVVEQFELPADRALDVSVALVEGADEPVAAPAARQASIAEPSAPPPADPVRDAPPADRGVRAPTWVAFGLGGAALGAAVGFEIMRRSAEDDARQANTQVEAKEAFDTMESHQMTSRILAGVGGAALLAGGILLVFDLSRSETEQTAANAAFAGGCAPSGCAFLVRGSL